MALEDIKRNAKRDIETDITEFKKGQWNQSAHQYILSKIELAASVSLITPDETKEYMAQISKDR